MIASIIGSASVAPHLPNTSRNTTMGRLTDPPHPPSIKIFMIIFPGVWRHFDSKTAEYTAPSITKRVPNEILKCKRASKARHKFVATNKMKASIQPAASLRQIPALVLLVWVSIVVILHHLVLRLQCGNGRGFTFGRVGGRSPDNPRRTLMRATKL